MDLIVVGCGFYSSLLTVRPHLLTVQDQRSLPDQTPSSRAVMQYIRAVNQGGWLARLPLGGQEGSILQVASNVCIWTWEGG